MIAAITAHLTSLWTFKLYDHKPNGEKTVLMGPVTYRINFKICGGEGGRWRFVNIPCVPDGFLGVLSWIYK